jgi:ferredoxin
MVTKAGKDMRQTYTTYALVAEGNNGPRIRSIKSAFSPRRGFSLQPAEGLLISGGFPALTPEAGFPVSPTLQLNGDLGALAPADLASLALAELERLNRISCHSYIVESDPRLCVLASSGDTLKKFLDTYGGVLDVQPLLLNDGSRQFPMAIDLHIETAPGGYEVQYTIRSQVDQERCTYCGLCGPACPAGCISEDLRIDVPLCTHCGICEQICPQQAIDLYGALRHRLPTPALLLLDGVKVDLPQDGPGIFSEKTLPSYFATLFASRIEEAIVWQADFCQYNGRLASGCGLCQEACSQGAISRTSKGIEVDAVICAECCACVAVCPTGALQYQRFPDREFFNYCRSIPLRPGTNLVIGSESSLHKLWWRSRPGPRSDLLIVEYPKVQALSLFHLLFLIALGARRIILLDHAGEGQWAGLQGLQVRQANAILGSFFDLTDRVVVSSLEDLDGHLRAGAPSPLKTRPADPEFTNRRAGLAAVLQFLVQVSGRRPHLPAAGISFAALSCDLTHCSQCLACLNVCRIGALSADENGLLLQYHGALCVGCGSCVAVCPEKALSLKPGVLLDESIFQPVPLARAEPMICRDCGKVYGTRRSFERVMEILSARPEVDTGHLLFCDTCRVVRLFEVE